MDDDGALDVSVTEAEDEDLGINITGAFGWAPQSMGCRSSTRGMSSRSTSAQGSTRRWTAMKITGNAGSWPNARWSTSRQAEDARCSTGGRSCRGGLVTTRASDSRRSRCRTPARSRRRGETAHRPVSLPGSMSCTDDGGLSPYPQGDVYASREDRELAFRYRNKPSFAIGHGVAVDWSPNEAPTTVTTTVLPEAEVGAIRAKAGRATSTGCDGLRTSRFPPTTTSPPWRRWLRTIAPGSPSSISKRRGRQVCSMTSRQTSSAVRSAPPDAWRRGSPSSRANLRS